MALKREKFLEVFSVSARRAIVFLGWDPDEARAFDVGPAPADRYPPGVRKWRVYRYAKDAPS